MFNNIKQSRPIQFGILTFVFLLSYFFIPHSENSFLWRLPPLLKDVPTLIQSILDNLWDEEHGEDNHVELWVRFCEALGLDRAQVENSTPDNSTKELIDSFLDLTSNRSLAGGASALFAFESQVPEVADTKIAGLKSFYGIEDKRGISFFKVHRDLDIEHSDAEAEMINSLATTEQEENDAVDSADIAASSLWKFLDGVYK